MNRGLSISALLAAIMLSAGITLAVEAPYVMIDLGLGSGPDYAINDQNSAGHTFINDAGRSFYSVDGTTHSVEIPLMGYDSSTANAINEQDQIVGYFVNATFSPIVWFVPFIWDPPSPGNPSGTVSVLNGSGWLGYETAQDISDDGTLVVGSASIMPFPHSFAWVWDSTHGYRRLPLPEDWMIPMPGAGSSGAVYINESEDTGRGPVIYGWARDQFVQTHSVKWVPDNKPIITTTPVTSGVVGTTYHYDVDATDPDGDPLVFSLETSPDGMTINPSTGLITWLPSPDQTGSNPVVVKVTDQLGAEDTQSFLVTVNVQGGGGQEPPSVPAVPMGALPPAVLLIWLVSRRNRRNVQ